MAYLFNINGQKAVYPTEEVLLISPFKEIWKRDKSKNKEVALAEFAYIEFTTSMLKSNPYVGYSEEKKPSIVKNAIGLPKTWKPDKLVKQALESIEVFQTEASTNYQYYLSAKTAAEKMQNFFRIVNVNEKNERGAPIYKPRDITSALNDTDKVLSNLNALKKKVEEELYQEIQVRGKKKISIFAKKESLKNLRDFK